jgi:anhydro-N-acetylmuramic acid kinase
VIGLMSGTSKDGIDAALVKLKGSGVDTKVEIIKFICVPYGRDVSERLDNILPTCTVQEISELNFLIGEAFADAALAVAKEAGFNIGEVDLIGSHGQTVFHNPPSRKEGIPSTLQIGETSVIAERTGVTTVGDFRTRDMASGGEGAPLVPYFDFLFFSVNNMVKIVQNIGGIANATVVTDKIEDVIAFDTGPGNMLMDRVINIATEGRESFDRGGKLASKGVNSNDLLHELMREPYFHESPPKSTGEELFGSEMAQKLFSRVKEGDLTLPDLMQTLLSFTVETIALSYEGFIFSKWEVSEIVFSGGGCKNHVLMQKLRDRLKGYECTTTDDYGIPSEAKEAVAFAVLANELVSGNMTNVPGATGASRRVPMGKIVLGR